MTRLHVWLDRLEGRARVAVFVAVVAGFAGAVLLAVAGPFPGSEPPARRSAAVGAPDVGSGRGAWLDGFDRASPAVTASSPTRTRKRTVTAADLAAAEDTARAFAVAYATAEPGEQVRDVVRRVEPHVTPALATRLERDLRLAAPPDGGRTVDAAVEHVHAHSSEPGAVVLVVLLRQRVAGGAGVAELRPSLTLRVVPRDGEWRVAEVVV